MAGDETAYGSTIDGEERKCVGVDGSIVGGDR